MAMIQVNREYSRMQKNENFHDRFKIRNFEHLFVFNYYSIKNGTWEKEKVPPCYTKAV